MTIIEERFYDSMINLSRHFVNQKKLKVKTIAARSSDELDEKVNEAMKDFHISDIKLTAIDNALVYTILYY